MKNLWGDGKGKRRKIYAIIAVLCVGGLILSAGLGFFDAAARGIGIFGENVMASVNGEEITREEFEVKWEHRKQMYRAQGIDLDGEEMSEMLEQAKSQLVEEMIYTKILLQHAEEENIDASSEEIAQELQAITAQFASEEEFQEQLKALGLTKEQLEKEIASDLVIQQYIDNYMQEVVQEEDLEVTEEEMRELYDQYGEQMEDTSFEEMKPQLKQMLEEEKRQQVLMDHIEDLREQKDIEIYQQ